MASAEDALADALEAALKTWPQTGIPQKPEAWLLIVARRRSIDGARRVHVAADAAPTLHAAAEEAQEFAAGVVFPDERLKLMFICAHPAIDAAARMPLMMQTVLGLDAARIASAFCSGWDDVAGFDPRRKGLAIEAIDLGRLLSRLMPGEPEVQGLLTLMLYCEARRNARRSPVGAYVPLAEQNVALWSKPMIEEAERLW